jgi:putative ABC transport system substrate-binding protein
MERREFITLFGGAVAGWPLSARAQVDAAILHIASVWFGDPDSDTTLPGLRKGLQDLGYVEGQNIKVDPQYAHGSEERLATLLANIVRTGEVDIIISSGTVATRAVKTATATIPVVSLTGDPVGSGIVTSIARPGGNITGFTLTAGPEIAEKWLELLHEAFPGVSRVAVLWNSSNLFSAALFKKMEDATDRLGFTLISHEIRQPTDFASAFDSIPNENIDAIVAETDPLVVAHRRDIVDFTTKRRLPAIYGIRDYVAVGGLMSYDASLFEIWRSAATYVDRIAKGANPGDLPIQQPTKFELIINLKAAKAVGLEIPSSLILRADQVIE